MKNNKLLILALPLLLAISACDMTESTIRSSSQESVSSSEEISSETSKPEPSSWEEEPIPVKTPEELEAEAWQNLSRFKTLLKTKPYAFKVKGSAMPIRNGIMGPGWRIFTKYNSSGPNTVGYIANKDGVLHVCTDTDYNRITFANGFAAKTNSLQESIALLDSLYAELDIVEEDWTYISNVSGISVFKTSSEAVLSHYAFLERGDRTVATNYQEVYASITSNGEAASLRAKSNLDFGYSTIFFGNFGSPVLDIEKEDDNKEARTFFEQVPTRDFSACDSAFTDLIRSKYGTIDKDKVPFPSKGNKYYFIDAIEIENLSLPLNNLKVGFIATGNIISSYSTELLDKGWTLVEDNTYKFNDSYYIKLECVESENTSSPTIYPEGIFYLNISTTLI